MSGRSQAFPSQFQFNFSFYHVQHRATQEIEWENLSTNRESSDLTILDFLIFMLFLLPLHNEVFTETAMFTRTAPLMTFNQSCCFRKVNSGSGAGPTFVHTHQ